MSDVREIRNMGLVISDSIWIFVSASDLKITLWSGLYDWFIIWNSKIFFRFILTLERADKALIFATESPK